MFLPIIAGMFTFVFANFLADKVADVITGAITEDDPEWRENDADFDKAVLHSATSVATYTVTSSVLNAALGAHPAVAAGMVLHTTYAIARAADHARSLDLELEGEASWSTTYARPHSTTGGGSAATSEPAQPTMQTQAQSSATVGGGGAQQTPGCSSVSGGCGSSNGGGQGGPVPTCLEQPSCIWATVTWHTLY
ncbi:hypothetical protein [Anaplasma marginale]|uniref:hypothetical protein n=1 Tax=Anaplasma marginale TaxID=770 RepID=UPI0001B467C9|nr:hypothetical protein [Anaplasma marginale]